MKDICSILKFLSKSTEQKIVVFTDESIENINEEQEVLVHYCMADAQYRTMLPNCVECTQDTAGSEVYFSC